MSELWQPGFSRRTWTLDDSNKQYFVVQTALDTWLRRSLIDMDEQLINGVCDLKFSVDALFLKFKWFVEQNNMKINGANHHYNYVMLANIVEHHLKTMYLMDDVIVYFDGEIGKVE